MAEVVEKMPARPISDRQWDEWLDGRVWRLDVGKDFELGLGWRGYMGVEVARQASIRGVKARTSWSSGDEPKHLYVQAIKGRANA